MIACFLALTAMMALSFLRLPISLAMGVVGFVGLWMLKGLTPSIASVTAVIYDSGFDYTLSVIPLKEAGTMKKWPLHRKRRAQ